MVGASARLPAFVLLIAVAAGGLLAADAARAWTATDGTYVGRDNMGGSGGPPNLWSTYDISTTGTSLGTVPDDGLSPNYLPAGFTFNLYGLTATSLQAHGNGFVTLNGNGACTATAAPGTFSTACPNYLIGALWDDWTPTAGQVRWELRTRTNGGQPEDVLVTQYTGVPPFSGTGVLNAQILLFEGSQAIEVHYNNMVAPSGFNTALIEGSGSVASQYLEYYDATGANFPTNAVQYRPSGAAPTARPDAYTFDFLVDGPTFTVSGAQNLMANDAIVGNVVPSAGLNTASVPSSTLAVVRSTGGTGNSIDADGDFVFDVPATNLDPCANGPYTFQYRLTDAWGQTAWTTATVTIVNCNNPPVANDQAASTPEDTGVAVTLAASDPDNDPLVYTLVTPPQTGFLSPFPATAQASPPQITFTPAADRYNKAGSGLESFTYRVTDPAGESDTATVTIDVTPVNDAPVLALLPILSLEDEAVSAAPAAYVASMLPAANAAARAFDEQNQTLALTIQTPCDAAFFLACPALAPDGTLSYAPRPDVSGARSITLRLADDGAHQYTGPGAPPAASPLFVQATLALTVQAVNDAPLLSVVPVSGLEEQPSSGTAWLASFAAGPATAVDEADQELDWAVVTPCDAAFFSACPTIDPATRILSFQPAPDQFGARTVQVRLRDDGTDNGPVDAVRQTVADLAIDVLPVNDAPTAPPGPVVVVDEDSASAGEPARSHTVPAWTTVSTGPANEGQTVASVTASGFPAGLFATAPALDADGTLRFVLAPDAFGTATGTFRVTDSGPHGGVHVNRVDVPATIQVRPVNDPPVANDDALPALYRNVPDQVVAPAALLGNDADVDGGALSVPFVQVTGVFGGSISPGDAGRILFTPLPDHLGAAGFTYRAFDGAASSNEAAVTFSVVDPLDPIVFIQPSADRVCQGDTVSLRAVAVWAGHTAQRWTWTAGDGSAPATTVLAGLSHTFTHPYAAAGDRFVGLAVVFTDGAGAETTVTTGLPLRVDACNPPVADFGASVAGLAVLLRDASRDPDGTPLARAWDFGDGATSTAAHPVHAYAAPGVYLVTLRVTDAEGDAATASRHVVVGGSGGATLDGADASATDGTGDAGAAAEGTQGEPVNRRPVARLSAPAGVVPGAEARLDASASSDPDDDPLTFQWLQVSGPAVVLVTDGPRAAFVAPAAPAAAGSALGPLVFRVRVLDPYGFDQEDATVRLEPAPRPAAGGAHFRTVPAGGLALAFVDVPAALSYAWDFGDGATGSDREPTHQYAEPGPYVVRLRTTTAAGTHESVQLVTVGLPAEAAAGPDPLPADLDDATPADAPTMPAAAWATLSIVGAAVLFLGGVATTVFLLRRR